MHSYGPNLIVESAASLHPKIFRHGDLHTFDVISIPEWFHERVGKPEYYDVIYGSLAKIMINAEDCGLWEGRVQDPVKPLR